ncbi:GNAT family N-acetyltransferase [Loigolactobacillus jiayinensis]|uniref:GNAT family N-acetyltransferase n=1 Tax=Loigolactobacillus jiayinensis TaxID=2486016 RepID=A0ABW1RHL8_9LACO|nr:N-acetyltransferase [Loigolactobacillus jiayinensis]
MLTVKISPVQLTEYAATQQVVQWAFSGSQYTDKDEHHLIGRLRQEQDYRAAFDVAARTTTGKIVGHAMLSEIVIQNQTQVVTALALAPLAVLPDYQHQGIGGQLINYLEHAARQANYPAISILGDSVYYGRFGYRPANEFGVKASFAVPAAFYLLKPPLPEQVAALIGTIQYQRSFNLA